MVESFEVYLLKGFKWKVENFKVESDLNFLNKF